ncbi:MAG: hypothetical protein KDA99_20445, partial [Planctomycetales bacterium]|nr:hypothetical protein [Planctomycetales bacterium]
HRPVIVWTKCDLPTSRSTIREWENLAGRTSATDVPGPSSIATSTVTLNGIEALKQSIVARLAEHDVFISDIVGTTAVRCSQSLQRAAEHLQAALAAASAGVGDEIVALELRSALEGLGEVVGTVYTDDVLDRIFSRFCIGK